MVSDYLAAVLPSKQMLVFKLMVKKMDFIMVFLNDPGSWNQVSQFLGVIQLEVPLDRTRYIQETN